MAFPGKNTVIQISSSTSSTGGSTDFSEIGDLNAASMNQSPDLIDVSDFGVDFIKNIIGLKDATFTLDGFWDSTDAGQTIIKNGVDNDTEVFVKFFPAGTSHAGFQMLGRVSGFEITVGVADAVEASFEVANAGDSGIIDTT